MIQKIYNTQEFYSIFRKGLPIQVLILDQEKIADPKTIQSTVTQLKKRYKKDAINFYSANTSEAKLQPLANLYQTDGSPTMLVFKKGQLQNKFSGTISKKEIEISVKSLMK